MDEIQIAIAERVAEEQRHHKKGQFFTCPGVPAEHVTLRLTQPLGTRGLLDGSTLPPHAPTADSSWTFR